MSKKSEPFNLNWIESVAAKPKHTAAVAIAAKPPVCEATRPAPEASLAAPAAFASDWPSVAPMVRPAPYMECWIEVTPELAEYWLSTRNTRNRPQRDSRIQLMVRDMRLGTYRRTHQGIAFDVNGVLCDGQHRLVAIVESGKAVMFRVTFGLEPDAIEAIDANMAARRIGDIIEIVGGSRGQSCAAMARSMIVLEERDARGVSFAQTVAVLARFNDAIAWAIPYVGRGGTRNGRITAPIAAALAYAWTVAPDAARAVADTIATLIDMGQNSPAYALHRAMTGARTVVEKGVSRPLAGDEWVLSIMLKTLRACQAQATGEVITRLYETEEGFKFFKAERLRRGLE